MYKFIKTKDQDNPYDTTNVTIEIVTDGVTTDNLCETFEKFLKACGFYIDGKIVELVDEESLEDPEFTEEDYVVFNNYASEVEEDRNEN